MDLRQLVRRWASAGLLVGLFAPSSAAQVNYDGVPLPPLGSVPPAAPAPGCSTCGSGDGAQDRYKDVPPVAVLPRAGWFPIPPTGPGYYTLCDELTGNCRQGPPKYPYSRTSIQANSFFDVDWR